MKRRRVIILKRMLIVLVFSAVFSKDLKAMDPEDTVSIELPTIKEPSPFNFILDPQRLITETDGAKYGSSTFEAGATLFFENSDSNYDFSSQSDMLTIMNKGAVPVEVTVTAWLDQIDNLCIAKNDFFEDEAASIFLALVDSSGYIQSLDESGRVSITEELHAVKGNTYDEYSFGLVGACNPNGNWMDLNVHPKITVIWQVTPVVNEETVQEKQEEEKEEQEEQKEAQEKQQEAKEEQEEREEIQEDRSEIPKEQEEPVKNERINE